jgi:ATP-binding cassette subfamily B (MDR/TAP) protein 1
MIASIVISQVAPFLQNFGAAAAAYDKLQKDLNRESALDGTSKTVGTHLETVTGEIEFKNVTFAYPSRPERPVVQDLSLVCPAGKHTAIVGLSGSGKSTIASLAVRLYDPAAGTISLDGQNIKDLNIQSLRSHMSLVQQESSLLDRSILENIALSLINSPSPAHAHLKQVLLSSQLADIASAVRDGKDIHEAAAAQGAIVSEIVEMVRKAATLSDAITFVDRLEYGLATTVGSTGNLMSGGQKQRIALARALVRDPKILILDEATALLDSSSEQRIQAAIEKIATGRTLISIAHRLSTVKNADNIIVMRSGQIIEQGSHAVLIAKEDGAYAAMVHLQSLDVDESNEPTTPIGDRLSEDTIAAEKISQKLIVEAGVSEKASQNESPKEPSKEPEGISSDRSTWSILKSMSPITRPYILVILVAFFTSTIVGGTYSVEAVIFGNTIGALSPCKSEDSIRSSGNLYGLLFFAIAIVTFFANAISWAAFGYTAEKILYKVRLLSFRSLFEQDLQWHQSEGRSPALLLTFITKDGNTLGGLTGSIIGTIYSILVNLLAAIILTHIVAWKIALVFLVTVPLLLGAGIMQLRVLTAFHEKHEKAFANSNGITVEAVNAIKTVQALSLEHEILGVYRRSLKGPRKEITRASAYANIWLAAAYSIGNFVYALAYWWGAKQIIAGEYTQAQFFTVVIALLVSAQLWGQMFMLAPELSKARGAIARILNLIDLGSTDVSSTKSLALHPDADGQNPRGRDVEASGSSSPKAPVGNPVGVAIELKDIAFSYPARPQIQVLTSLSLNIRPGQFCALVGPSGAGKSTIINLIERMYAPASGSVTIDGLDISQNSSVSFRHDIALVPQESVLFEGSIRFNVSLGARPGCEVTAGEIEDACRLANIHDTIIGLPEGYDTNCGPNGSQLSGGQKQRLCIARALVRKPRLLLLDESTSALDAESEQLLQEGLDKAVSSGGVTVVAIAHRLRTIRRADVIFLIEAGKCVDQGTHDELVVRSESYRVNALHQTFDS